MQVDVRRFDSSRQTGRVVTFLVMPSPDFPQENIVVAVVVWDGGGITSERLANLVAVSKEVELVGEGSSAP